jgi:septum formation protein
LGVEFEVVVPEVEEVSDGRPEEVVLENARRKAGGVSKEAPAEAVVLGADTEVVLDGKVLGKAGDEAQARGYLEILSGRTHEVLGGLVLLGPGDGPERSGVARSTVTFGELSPETIDLYLASGEWRDRAGAYAIQGLGSILVERLEGDFSNVVGLPLGLLLELAPELRPAR